MAYVESGTLTTDKSVIEESNLWDTDADWQAYQSKNNIAIVDGSLVLATPSGPVILDGFEDGDIAEYGGDLPSFGVDTASAYAGNYGAYGYTDNAEKGVIVNDQITISAGDAPFGVYVQDDRASERTTFGTFYSGGTPALYFGVPSVSGMSSISGYAILLNTELDSLSIAVYENGTQLDSQAFSISLSYETWYKIVVTGWATDGTIDVEIRDINDNVVGSYSFTYQKYTSGFVGLGFNYGMSNSENGPYFDNIFGPIQ